MKKSALNKLKAIKNFEGQPIRVIERDDELVVSAEEGDGMVDYYGEFRGGLPYIDPEIEKWAKENKGYWEWESPGAIVFVED